MSYFLSNKNLIAGSAISLEGEEAFHIMLSRRIKPGEHILLQGPDGKRFKSEVVKLTKKTVDVSVLDEIEIPKESKTKITLFQAVVSEKALDFIFQKSTELGAYKIVLFNSAHTATKLSQDVFNKKKDRWEKILWEAAKQSDRSTIPQLRFSPPKIGEVPEGRGGIEEELKSFHRIFILDAAGDRLKGTGSNFPLSASPLSLGLLIGPEGGLTPEEIDSFKEFPNAKLISLGPIILKAETAALASIAILRNMFD
jgi:16S rRNA (uracil1498-N3)-methyltransferase